MESVIKLSELTGSGSGRYKSPSGFGEDFVVRPA